MVSSESLRRLITSVPQNTELFAGSVLENITMFRNPVDQERFYRISEQLALQDIFENLPEGYHSYIGEHGISLSGGEKQKIALARALYADTEILFLDEATASMDPLSEETALEAIRQFHRSGK